MKVEIRKARKKDLKKIDEIFRVEYLKWPYNEKWSKKLSFAKIKKYFDKSFMFILNVGGEMAGFIIGHIDLWDRGKVGYMDEVVVSQKFQGKNYGKMLMNHLNKHFKKYNIKNLDLITNPKSKAYKIYKKMGFKELKDFTYMTKKIK